MLVLSGNLYRAEYEHMSQTMWAQDFEAWTHLQTVDSRGVKQFCGSSGARPSHQFSGVLAAFLGRLLDSSPEQHRFWYY